MVRTDRLGVDILLSSLGVTDLSWRTETVDGERETDLLLGVDGRERGVLKGAAAGEDSGRALVVLLETLSLIFPFLNLSLCGVVASGASVADPFTDSAGSTEGNAMSGSRSMFTVSRRTGGVTNDQICLIEPCTPELTTT